MESKFWLYAYIILGGAVLFAGGYYLGLSGKGGIRIESENLVPYQKNKESKKELQQAEFKAMSSPASSKVAFDSTVTLNEGH